MLRHFRGFPNGNVVDHGMNGAEADVKYSKYSRKLVAYGLRGLLIQEYYNAEILGLIPVGITHYTKRYNCMAAT